MVGGFVMKCIPTLDYGYCILTLNTPFPHKVFAEVTEAACVIGEKLLDFKFSDTLRCVILFFILLSSEAIHDCAIGAKRCMVHFGPFWSLLVPFWSLLVVRVDEAASLRCCFVASY